ncbi:MAG TPA: ArsR family transcriptional regulator [Acidimicrobiales bacterium]|jgi:ArsR family transcriptional regulator, arsenate/arsenite/antimonite-responsive transcriptional repressor / arsenate reductase (thioredoxin)|nr:ArsR family transcriptional regulator [Acidimicrobiales bacterium]
MAVVAAPAPPEILGLLADPVRWQIVGELGRSDRRVGELVRLTGKPQNLVSYHLSELRRGGVVTSRRSSADGRDVYYRVDLLRCGRLLGDAAGTLHPGLARVHDGGAAKRRTKTQKVLFLCTGNSARSQMAEALAQVRSGGVVEARSAGSHPKPLHHDAVRVMAERGIDISGWASKPLSTFERTRFDRVVTLCDKVREVCPEFPGSPTTAHWSVADPSLTNAFDAAADEIEERVDLLLAELTKGTAHA